MSCRGPAHSPMRRWTSSHAKDSGRARQSASAAIRSSERRFTDALKLFQADPQTEAVVLIGEIGGTAEEEAAQYITAEMSKPVFVFIAGATAPPGRRMGHAGAIIAGGKGTAEDKFKALGAAGAVIVKNPALIGATVREHMAAA